MSTQSRFGCYLKLNVKRIGRMVSLLMLTVLLLNSCITLTSKKKEITFTSEPSGAAVYRMFSSTSYTVDGVNT